MLCETLFPVLTTDEILAGFCPTVREWWQSRFADFSLPQRLAVPAIHAGKNTLICVCTGSGKTLCAFISILSDLFTRRSANALPQTIDTLYISPLKALGADITRNLTTPLTEITAAQISQFPIPNSQFPSAPITIAQRTGDTSPKDRRRLVKFPPHILVTTPESLALCLANKSMRDHLISVRRIIIDELHSLAPNKRGVDLMLSVERLSDLVISNGNPDPQRIGLSATIAPLDRMAAYLVGSHHAGRACCIADGSFDRPLELDIASVFGKTPFATTAAINKHVYDLLEKTIRAHRTTLVFTNLRAATERVTFALRKRFAANPNIPSPQDSPLKPPDFILPHQIEAHHSSLDRDVRFDIERRLKAGELRCVVCSTSLELGIDIGSIDRVILLNSPKGVARGLQRVGRSGHSLNGIAKGTFVPTVPADLIEALVTADAMRKKIIQPIDFPKCPLDILAQHLIGMALQNIPRGIDTNHAYNIARRTLPFADLTHEQFHQALQYIATPQLHDSANVAAKLYLEVHPQPAITPNVPAASQSDVISPGFNHSSFEHSHLIRHSPFVIRTFPSGILHPRRRSTLALYAQNVGTITQEGQVKVKIQHAAVIGSIEEAFAQLLKPGDRFVLGGRCVQFVSAKGMTAEVTESSGQSPTVPRWFSGSMSMEAGLASRMRDFRAKVRATAPAGQGAILRMLTRQFSVNEESAKPAAAFLDAQFRYADIPTAAELLVERVPDEDATVLVFHTMIGRAANEALARTVAFRLHQRFSIKDSNAAVVVDDYAFGIWIQQSSAARRADRTLIRSLLTLDNFHDDLAAAIESSELFRAQFRFTAIRAHAILQNNFGRRRYIGQMQSYATRLHQALKDHHPDHFLLTETRRTVMHDILSAPLAENFLAELAHKPLRLLDLASPSPFSFGLFATGKRDTLQLADTADFLLAMYEQVKRRLTPAAAELQPQLFS